MDIFDNQSWLKGYNEENKEKNKRKKIIFEVLHPHTQVQGPIKANLQAFFLNKTRKKIVKLKKENWGRC